MALRAIEPKPPLPDALNAARSECGWSQEAFWLAYRQNGGVFGFEAFKDYLRGDSTPNVYEYDIMAEAVNTELGEVRLPRVPFDPPSPRPKWVARESNPEPTDRWSVAPEIRVAA